MFLLLNTYKFLISEQGQEKFNVRVNARAFLVCSHGFVGPQ